MEDFVQKPEDVKVDWIAPKPYEGKGYNSKPGEDPELIEKERELQGLKDSMKDIDEE